MEEYKEIIQYYNSTLIFKLSQIGYALNCNLIFSDRLEKINIYKSFELIQFLKDLKSSKSGKKLLQNSFQKIVRWNYQK